MAPSATQFSAASRTGSLKLASLEAASRAVDAALAERKDPLARRLEFLPMPGVPLRLQGAGLEVNFFWPYPPGSRHGGPEQLASPGPSENLRDQLAPFAAYFGAGTRGAMMAWLGDRAARGELPPGSAATGKLQAIAAALFWDVPMQQVSDARLIGRGMATDLSQPEAMAQYLRHQRDAVSDLIARQLPEVDGPAYLRAGRDLHAMLDAALQRTEAFLAGDRAPLVATPLGPYAWYDQTAEPGAAAPLPEAFDLQATPQELRATAERLERASL